MNALALALWAAGAAVAQPAPGTGDVIGQEEHAEYLGPEETLLPELDGFAPAQGSLLPLNAHIAYASKEQGLVVSLQGSSADTSSEGVVVEPAPLVPGCLACVYLVELPAEVGEPTVVIRTARDQVTIDYEVGPDEDREPPILDDAPHLNVDRQTQRDLLGNILSDTVTVTAEVRPPRSDVDVLALIATAGREGEAFLPAAARLHSSGPRAGCHPCRLTLTNPPGSDEGRTCVQVEALDVGGNRGRSPVACIDVPEAGGGCAQSRSGDLALGALMLVGLVAGRRHLARRRR